MIESVRLHNDDPRTLLGETLFTETVKHFAQRTGTPPGVAERQVVECVRYLYLLSKYGEQLGGSFLPVEQPIDDIWHYLILQTREYAQLCERLPGGFFIHHRSLPYEDYQRQTSREQLIEESLRWLPLYRLEFGPFDEEALPHWTMARFLHDEVGLSLAAIAALGTADAR